MKKILKALTFVLFCMISFTGLLFGCAGKYDNVKVTSDKDDTGLKLYIGEDTEGDVRSVGTITFYVENLEDGAKNLKLNFEGYEESKIVRILDKSVSGNSLTVTLQAISGGSTKLIALTEVGMKSDAVQVDCIKRLESFSFVENYSPAMFNVPGSKLTIDTKKINFTPNDTTQNQVVYSIEPAVDGANITAGGVITLTYPVNGPINVFARSVDNESIFDTVLVHLIDPIETEDGDGIEIFTESGLYKDGQITLTTDGEESFLTFRVDVNTTENITYNYTLLSVSDSASGNANCVNIDQNVSEFSVRANDIGECKLVLYIGFADYNDAPVVKKEIGIKVVELPKTITVNGNTEDFSDNIYTYYDNNKGKEFAIDIGEFRAYNKTFMIAVSDPELLSVCRNDGKVINLATYENGELTSEGDLLLSGQSIFVKGLQANQSAELYVVAYGTAGFKSLLVKTINLNILLGSESVVPVQRTFDGEPNSTYYVEIGKSFELDYTIDENSSAYGIMLVQSDGSALNGIISTEISTGLKPTIVVNGLEVGEITCKLLLENLVESNSFVIKVFKQVEYLDDEHTGGIYFSVDSPLENPNIALAEYIYQGTYRTLSSFVLSIGTTVQLKNIVNPADATIFDLTYSSVIIRGEEQISAIDYLYVSDSGNVTARKMFPETIVVDGESVSQQLAILVKVESLTTDESGNVIKVVSTKIVSVEIYLPISDVKISKQTSTIYWNNGQTLNPIQVDGGAYADSINLTVYSDAVNLSKVHVNWDCPNELSIATENNGLSATISAFDMPENAPEKSIYTVTATIQYYSTTIVRRCIFTVIKPTRAASIVAYIDDIERNVAYFELGTNSVSPETIKVNTAVYSASGKQDVTFDNVYFMSRNENVAVVDANGNITPVGAGKTEIWVYAEDMMPRLSSIGEFKIIKVIVADGETSDSAFRIRSESDFEKLENNPNAYYYLSSDVNFTKQHYIAEFGGNLDGKGYSLIGVMLSVEKPSLIGEIKQGAEITNLNISASFNIVTSDNLSIAGLAQTNNGSVENVNVYFVNSAVKVNVADVNLTIAGLVAENNSYINASSVSANFEAKADETLDIASLYIGGLVAINNGTLYGSNQNYEYRPLSSVQTFDFTGSINVNQNITATNSAIGGIFAVNNAQSQNEYDLFGYFGFASNVVINAITINNVGGIAGVNNGAIYDVLTEANIVANQNVGGIAGINFGAIDNAVVEMYQSVSNNEVFGKVEGSQNVGGIVGCTQGVEDAQNSTFINATIQHAYVYAYAEQGFVSGENYVGGIVGYAENTDIEKTYANTVVVSLQTAGGIVGYAENLTITNAYAIVTAPFATTFGSAVGEANANVAITNFYSTFAGDLVGSGNYAETDSYMPFMATLDTEFDTEKTYYEKINNNFVQTIDTEFDSEKTYYEAIDLKDINTYANWSISVEDLFDAANSDYYDWFISSAENDGYPTLIYNGFLMRKVQPSQINLDITNAYSNQTINGVLVLYANNLYALSDILSITTDVTSKASIYVYSSVEGILNTKNTTNLLSNRATLKSTSEQVITLTFVLGNNPSIKEQIQIAFINPVSNLSVEDVNIKLHETVTLNSTITTNNENFALIGSSNFKLGIEDNEILNYVTISNSNILGNVIIFDGDSVITGDSAYSNGTLSVGLYYKLTYVDLNGLPQIVYYKMPLSATFDLNVYVGASNIHITSTNIDLTLIDAVTFTVTLDTDDANDKIVITNQANSRIKYVGTSDYVEGKNIGVSDSATLELNVLNSSVGVQDGKLTVTFELRFTEDYLNSTLKFTQMFTENLEFSAQSNQYVKKSIKITAQPQNLLKIDLTNYSAGKKNGTTYERDDIPSNTLTPGQMGMITVDIYPKYAHYDEIQLVSSVTSNGKAINFIQVAKYIETNDDGTSSTIFLDILPNLSTIENGIVLRQYSDVYFENNNPVYSFNGRFYINTIISSNVNSEEIVTVTATGITNVLDENGHFVQTRQVIKTIDITIKPAPEVALTQALTDTVYTAPVYENDETVPTNYNLIYKGQTINFVVEQKNGLAGLDIRKDILVNGKHAPEKISISDKDLDVSGFALTASTVNAGDIITVQVYGTKIINGFVETYYSKTLKYLVVDYIITGIEVDGATDGVMSFDVNVPKGLTANLKCIGYDFENEKEIITTDIKNNEKINKTEFTSSFWSGYLNGQDVAWNLEEFDTAKDIDTKTKKFNTYTVYKTWTKETSTYSDYGILATNKSNEISRFTVGMQYYYMRTSNGLELVVEPVGTNGTKMATAIEETINMKINISSNLDEPVTIYTIDDFYSMTAGTDYILMNDLYFGYNSTPVDENGKAITSDKYASTYTPFDLTVNSFDGNMHKIHINGNCFNTSGGSVANFGLFISVANGSILKDLDIVYENDFVDDNETRSATTSYFAGAVVRNSGVISNVNVYYKGDVIINSANSEGEVYIAGFAYNNDGKITYSAVYGLDFNDELKAETKNSQFKNVKFTSKSNGNIAGFVGANTDLISNCEVEFVGIENTAPASRNAKIGGFAITNSGTIYNSSAAGQRITRDNKKYLEKKSDDIERSDNDLILPIKNRDERISNDYKNNYFARLSSNGNIAGFVYTNSGSIENAYSIFPMETQSRTAGFVFDNSNFGSVFAAYTASFYDGTNTNNSAYAPFVGTNELGEVLNDPQNSTIRYCYYLLDTEEVYEEDIMFKEPASRISIDVSDTEDSVAITVTPYIGFDISGSGTDTSHIWGLSGGNYVLPVLNSNLTNQNIRSDFERPFITTQNEQGEMVIKFGRAKEGGNAPYQIADALQFVNVFNNETVNNYLDKDIRLINDIDLSEYAGTELLNKIRQVVFNGDFDGNGMTISGIKLIGGSSSNVDISQDGNEYLYSSSSFGLFSQIGTATISTTNNSQTTYTYNNFGNDGNTAIKTAKIRSLTLKVDEVSKSTSVFTGILAGVIINTDIKSLKIQSNNIYVLGRNAVGGVAGGIFGSSTLYNVSVNASVTSSYQQFATSAYRDKGFENIENYKFVDYTATDNKIDFAKRNEDNNYLNGSYAGGIAGIVDLYQDSAIGEEIIYTDGYINTSDRLTGSERVPNINVVTVHGNVSMIGEIVGGLFGTTNEDTYIAYAMFEVSPSDSQKLQGYFTAGGIVGIANGSVIRFSKVEVSQAQADNYDTNLTNQTGNTLFDTQTYPLAIGGLAGVQRGGYILSSYSKTNVINARAKYAGGVIGYLTDFTSNYTGTKQIETGNEPIKNLKNGRFVLLEEVYSTGNVFAGDEYDYQYSDGTTGTATPTSYVGGIVGYYKPLKIENKDGNEVNNDAFNGVVGINAFHMPNGYTLPTTYKVEGTSSTPKYSDVMKGYTGTRNKADGSTETIEFKTRIGSIFGMVDSDFDITYEADGLHNNIYTNFVYNNTTITANDCTRANGKEIGYVATSTKAFTKSTSIDTYKYQDKSEEITVKLNEPSTSLIGNTKTIQYSETYLVLRGNGQYDSYQQNENGIYVNWDDNWLFKTPIYPKFKPTNFLEYIEIKTESDLKSIRSGNKYKIVNDIYLTQPWTGHMDLSYATIISAKRNDSFGIEINNQRSLYFAIYNINLINPTTNNDVGFFDSIRYTTIKNVNFVFGTAFNDGGEYIGDQGLNVSTNKTNVGLLVGSISRSSAIDNCNIILNKDVTYSAKNITNVGVVAGQISDSAITNTNILCGTVSSGTPILPGTPSPKSLTPQQVEFTAQAQNVGGVVGSSSNSVLGAEIENLTFKFTPQSEHVYIGGMVGKFESNNNGTQNIKGRVEKITINLDNGGSNLYAGGVAGHANKAKINGNFASISVDDIIINTNEKTFTNAFIGGLFGKLSSSNVASILAIEDDLDINLQTAGNVSTSKYVGGFAGQTEGSTIENIEKLSISMADSGSFTEWNAVGGIVGYLEGSTIYNISTSNVNIENSSTVYNGSISAIGGAVGYMSTTSASSIKINGLLIENSGNVNKLYLAGFVGGIGESRDSNVENSYVTGNIIRTGMANETYLAGFASSGTLASVNNSPNAINTCVSDVEILFTENDSNVNVAGFAVEGFANIQNCASVGNIIFADEITDATTYTFAKTLFQGKAAGFTCMNDSAATVSNCYSFSTLKFVGEGNSSKVKATSFDSSNKYGIYFNYNLSGVFDLSAASATIGNGSNQTKLNMTYSDLLNAKVSNKSIISNDLLFEIFPIGSLGQSKLKPHSLSYGTGINQRLCYYFNDYTWIANDSNNNFIWSADSDTMNAINSDLLQGTTYYSGFTFSSLIATNNGYIFNCAMIGESGFTTTGFAHTNSGIINACGTNAIVDVNNQAGDVAGFVLTNSGLIANSYAANIFKNQTNATSVSGFVNANLGNIYNCFASASMFDINGTYSNRNLFAPNGVSNYSNCFWDNQTRTGATSNNNHSLNYSNMVTHSATMFGRETNQTQNYGYATPFTFTGSYGIGKIGTGYNTSSEPYIINNFGRVAYLTNIARTSTALDKKFYAKLVIDIDANNYSNEQGIEFKSNNNLTGTIKIANDNLLSIYGIKLSGTGLFSAGTITLENFGLYGTFSGSTSITSNKGFLVGQANTLTATNCYAILDQDVTIESDVNFGVLAGNVSGPATITNCFAYANNITVNASANVGVMIGNSGETEIKESYAAGVVKIKTESANVGGFVGHIASAKNLKDSWKTNISYVVLKNYTQKTKSELNVNAVVGLNDGTKVYSEKAGSNIFGTYYNEYYTEYYMLSSSHLIRRYYYRYYESLSLISGDYSLVYTGASLGSFGSNSIINSKLLQSGSLLKPIELTSSTSIENSLFYYLSNNMTLNSSISTSPAMIIGNGKTVTMPSNGTSALLSASNPTTTVSGVTIENGILASDTFDGYAYKVTTAGNRNLNYGFVKETSNSAVFDACSSTGTISSNSSSVSGFANTYSGGLFRSITVNAVLESTNLSESLYHYSGMFNDLSSTVLTLNGTNITLKTKKPQQGNVNNDYGTVYVGGIISEINSTNTYTLLGDLKFVYKDDSTQHAMVSYIGGIAGVIIDAPIFNWLLGGADFSVDFDCVDNAGYTYAGGLAGLIEYTKGEDNPITFYAKFTVKSFNFERSRETGICYVGGAIGWSRSANIFAITVKSATFDITNGFIGGIIGVVASVSILEQINNYPQISIASFRLGRFEVTCSATMYLNAIETIGCLIGHVNAKEFSAIVAYIPKTCKINNYVYEYNSDKNRYMTDDTNEWSGGMINAFDSSTNFNEYTLND